MMLLSVFGASAKRCNPTCRFIRDDESSTQSVAEATAAKQGACSHHSELNELVLCGKVAGRQIIVTSWFGFLFTVFTPFTSLSLLPLFAHAALTGVAFCSRQ